MPPSHRLRWGSVLIPLLLLGHPGPATAAWMPTEAHAPRWRLPAAHTRRCPAPRPPGERLVSRRARARCGQSTGTPPPRVASPSRPRGTSRGGPPRARTPAPRLVAPAGLDASTVMAMDTATCHAYLRAHDVRFRAVRMDAIEQPIRLRGPIAGIEFVIPWSSDPGTDVHAVWDCRLAATWVALAGWLAGRGVTEIQYFSVFRPGNRTRGSSQHHRGLAIDVRGWVHDGTLRTVIDTFEAGRLQQCPPSVQHAPSALEPAQALFHRFTCHAWRNRLAHTLLTPDHDRAHRNHLHVDLKSEQATPANPYVSLASGSAPEPP